MNEEVTDELVVAMDAAKRFIRPETVQAVALAVRALEGERARLTAAVAQIEDSRTTSQYFVQANISLTSLVEQAIFALVLTQPSPPSG